MMYPKVYIAKNHHLFLYDVSSQLDEIIVINIENVDFLNHISPHYFIAKCFSWLRIIHTCLIFKCFILSDSKLYFLNRAQSLNVTLKQNMLIKIIKIL